MNETAPKCIKRVGNVICSDCKDGAKTTNWIIGLTKEGCGIRSIARLLGICCKTVQSRILNCCLLINKPSILLNQTYEVDELCTYIGNKSNRIWVAYSYCQGSKTVVDFIVGSRNKTTLMPLINSLLCSLPVKIHTDKHQVYASLIPVGVHSTKCRGTNHIERYNLTLRTHLKRLSRRSICYSKSAAMLFACLKIYFWG